jgi:uncharacterized protein YdiU (UPF0061 family)
VHVSASYRPRAVFEELGDGFADPVAAAEFPRRLLRFRNQRWAERVGLGQLSDAEWERAMARFEPLPDNLARPLALRYHGHQFRSYNPELGDGRGFLYAQLLDDRDRILDLATKGSGQTPYSRAGDGRLTLKGGVREVLATEMLEALGVNTSKTFSLFETGEELVRHDEPSPTRSAVLVRLGHSHIRFGSFQRHAFHNRADRVEALVRHGMRHYSAELCHFEENRADVFLQLVVQRSARLCAQWMVAGFVHGVLNTDNMNITGESFDYGPYRFLPICDPGFTAAYFDHAGLYCYARQPEAVHWNLRRLADALSQVESHTRLERGLRAFPDAFRDALDGEFLRRLGLIGRGPAANRALREAGFAFLTDSRMPFERFFFELYGRGQPGPEIRAGAADFLYLWKDFEAGAERGEYFEQPEPCTLLIDEIEAIWSAIAGADDWRPFERKVEAIRAMGRALSAPDPATGVGR